MGSKLKKKKKRQQKPTQRRHKWIYQIASVIKYLTSHKSKLEKYGLNELRPSEKNNC